MIVAIDRDIAKRRITLVASAFVIGLTLASCTTTSINQNGAGDNACANNSSCSQGAITGQPPGQSDSPGSGSSSTASTSPQGSTSLAASAPQAPKQYSSVSFASLCSSQYATQSDFQACSGSYTAEIGQNVYDFPTWAPAYDPASDDDPPLLSFSSTTCRSLSLRFVIEPGSEIPSELRVTVSVVSRGSRSVTIAPNQLGTLNTTLTGGPLEIDASASLPMGGGWNLLMGGSASCSTASGS